jgi:hypothetical protein
MLIPFSSYSFHSLINKWDTAGFSDDVFMNTRALGKNDFTSL